jgi:hypothetical protein
MIQSNYKPVELKPVESAKPSTSSSLESNKLSKSNSPAKNEFKQELSSAKKEVAPKRESAPRKDSSKKEIAATDSHEPKLKKVEVSSDKALRAPSSLINEETEGAANSDTISPKFFDPELTKGVEKLIDPQTVKAGEGASPEEVLKSLEASELQQLAEMEMTADAEISPEIAQALLKTPQVGEQVEAGRAPAIEFAQAEIDPQLMSMEDFVAQKNLVQKKAMPQANAYGMKNPAMNKLMAETDLKQTQVVKDLGSLEGTTAEGTGSSVNSQQFILNNLAEQSTGKAVETHTAAPVKTFDMSHLKTTDAGKIMDQISDYIIQAKASKEPTVSMRMNHQELGMIDITVARAGVVNSDAVAINIGTHSIDGKNFFQQNSKDLFSHLTSAGIQVADMKVETAQNNAKSDFDFGQQSQKQSFSGERQFGSEQNQRRHEQERRADLWKMFNKEAA